MPIESEQPLEIPAIPAKEKKIFNSLWLSKIVINMPSSNRGAATIIGNYYDSSSGDIINDEENNELIYISDLPKCIEEVSEVAIAMQKLLEAIPKARQWSKEIENTENNE